MRSMAPDHEYHLLEVVEVVDETADTKSFVLEIPPELDETFTYTAGQYCTFRATIDGESVVRSYSMSSAPETGDPFTTTVKRVPEGRMSNWMNDTVGAGTAIEVMRPAGRFVLRDRATPIVAFAGGSGITPVLSVIKAALVATARPIQLVYANRSADAVIFRDALERLRSTSDGRLSVHHHLDDERGYLDAAQCHAFASEHPDADVYVCGPGAYMDVVEAGLATTGIAADQVFIERFTTPDAGPVPTDDPVPDSIVIRLDQRKHTLAYRATDTVLETARRGGLGPPFSCEAGNCATCMAHLDRGTVRMRVNNALTSEELDDGWVLTCQSIPTSDDVVVNYDA